MLQLCSPALVLAAVAGGVSAAIGPIATLPIISAQIAPDGFPRPWVLPPLLPDTMSNSAAPFTVPPSLGVRFLDHLSPGRK